jgi:hypothetical protein
MTVPLPPTGPLLQSPPRAETVRFIYSAGDRPLEGYTIKRGIGRGGFGEVYYGTSDGGKEVALKLVQRNLEVELRGVSQCLNLKHPNLVGLYDIRQAETGDYWIVMEYVAGESLADLLDRYPQGLSTEQARRWIDGICAAVGYLHERGIVHRDLKPANIFIEDGTVKIGDYGLSKFITASRRSGQTESVGTVHYMAPEIANGRYGKEIDIYAAGVILYEMLTGQVPFDGESVGEILMKHLTAEPDVSALDEPYRRVVARALAKDPQARYASLREMLADLGAAEAPSNAASFPEPSATVTTPPTRAAEPMDLGERDLVGASAAPRRPASRRPVPPPPPPGGVWVEVVRDDPIVGWMRDLCRGISPDNPWHVAAVAAVLLFVASTGFLGGMLPIAALCYVAVALTIRWLKGPSEPPAKHRNVGADRPAPPVAPVGPSDVPSGTPAMHSPSCGRPVRRSAGHRALLRSLRLFIGLSGLIAAFALLAVALGGLPHGHMGMVKLVSLVGCGFATSWFLAIVAFFPFVWWEKRRMLAQAARGDRDPALSPAGAVARPLRRKLLELSCSMIAVFPVVLLLCFLLSTMAPPLAETTMVMLGEVAVLGSLAVLAVAKWWEGRHGDPWVRRCVMLVVGLAVGAAAAGLDSALWISWDGGEVDFPWSGPATLVGGGSALFTPDGQPSTLGYLAYFGMLFFLIPWWWLTDPARRMRLSAWRAVIVPAAIAWLLPFVWPFPQPWGLVWAVMIAVTVQLVSPRRQQVVVEGR